MQAKRHRLYLLLRAVSLAACAAWLLLAGCSETAGPADAAAQAEADSDATDPPDGTDSDTSQLDLTSADNQALVCPGGAYCACTTDTECDTGLCLDSPQGKVCGALCQTSGCKDQWQCAKVNSKSGDILNICVPRHGFLCEPCEDSAQCAQALGSTGASCVDYGAASGSFCGSSCQVATDCPTGYLCQDATTIEGKPTRQCVLAPDSKGVVQCPCDARASALKLSTACKAPNELGSCPGYRVCEGDGLSVCKGLKPKAEVCDGIDNDCNGKTDDGLCNDDNPCTQDSCEPATGKCKITVLDGTPCSDGNACTGPDKCSGDQCKGGPTSCDDNNPCTDDSCDPAKGCVNAGNTKPCSDNNACTANDLCDGKGACLGLAVDVSSVCADTNPCTADACDPGSGCIHPALAGICEDGNPCTNGDQCSAGQCIPGQNVCGCQQTSDCATKEDGNLCNGTLYCDKTKAPYVCSIDPKTVVSCDTSKDSVCLQTSCAAATGQCKAEPAVEGKLCNSDDSVCTKNDACKAGVCSAGAAVSCSDDNPCTDDACDPKTGCNNPANIAPCEDGNQCTKGDACKNGACIPGAKTACDDGSACTFDSCVSATGLCKHDAAPLEGTSCDADGSACTLGDSCSAGKCLAGTALQCGDGNPCTDDSCNPKTGCVKTNNVASCEADGNLCTPVDTCKNGSCSVGPSKDCNDKNSCTNDSCDGVTGQCKHAALDGAGCDDGDKCTQNDLCKADKCSAGPAVDCDDKNACTTDGCQPASGCNAPVNVADGSPCDDAEICTNKDICVAGKCAGIKLNCDDGNSCTTDSCSASGCLYKAVADATPCGTGNWCVTGVCKKAACGDGYVDAKTGELCDDGNAGACDGCEACQPRGVLTLDGKSWAEAAATPVAGGALTGQLGLDKEMTLEAWIMPDNLLQDVGILSKAKVGPPAASAWTLGLMATTGALFFHHNGPEGSETLTTTGGVAVKKWSHVAAVITGGRLRLYVNGQPQALVGQPGLAANLQKFRADASSVAVQVGRRYADFEASLFTGAIDAVRLTAAPLYGAAFVPVRFPAVEPETRALWLFDDAAKDLPAGTVATDRSLNGNLLKKGGAAATAKDSCYGADPKAGVCGDGVVAPAFEACDQSTAACAICDSCKSEKAFHVAGQLAGQSPPIGQWAPDAICPTCQVTVEAWVRLNGTPGPATEIVASTCGYFSLMVYQGTFAVARYPMPLLVAPAPADYPKWYHVAAVVDWSLGGQARLYVDGKLAASAQHNAAQQPTIDATVDKEVVFVGSGSKSCLQMGGGAAPANIWVGQIDEVRISAGMRYHDNFTPRRTPLPDRQTRGLWHFSEGSGASTFADDSGAAVQLTASPASSSWVAEGCYGQTSQAVCGDSQAASWESCDNGSANGPPPGKLCSGSCTLNDKDECTAAVVAESDAVAAKISSKNSIMTYPANWTLEGWVKVAAYPKSGIGWLAGAMSGAAGCPQPTKQEWILATNSDGTDASRLGGVNQIASKSTKVWKTGVWQHFALQYEGGGRGSLWVDGALARSFTNVPTAWSSTCPMLLGSDGMGGSAVGEAIGSLRLSKKTRYGQPFFPATVLAVDTDTLWRFDFAAGSAGATFDSTQVYKIGYTDGKVQFAADGPQCP